MVKNLPNMRTPFGPQNSRKMLDMVTPARSPSAGEVKTEAGVAQLADQPV